MGKLLDLERLTALDWYFESAYYDWQSRMWRYKLPDPQFPVMLSIHRDDMVESRLKIKIRKWIESNCAGDVIYLETDKSYWHKTSKYDGYQMSNHWYNFHFEDEVSATAFKLKFSEYVQEMTDEHPKHRE